MRVVLVGPAERRERLRSQLPAGAEIAAEASTLSAARALGVEADAYLLPASQGDERGPVEALTARETDVVSLLADGLPNKAIAARLGVSEETVKFHLAAIFGKLGVSNRTAAVRIALRRGLVAL
jgi:DNA-binding NarL/FixJ family response regulator